VQVSPVPNVGEEQQQATQQGDFSYSGGLIPLVIDLEDSSETPDESVSTSRPSTALTQTVEQPFEEMTATEAGVEPVDISDYSTAAESTVTAELSAVTDTDTGTPVDLVVARQPCPYPITTEASVGGQGFNNTAAESDVNSAALLSDEYQKRYEKYESLCTLIRTKDRELVELNDERNRLHQALVDLQRAILAQPVAAATTTSSDALRTTPPNSTEAMADGDQQKERDESEQGELTATNMTAVAYRRRLAHRGVTSVRVMVKSTQPPTAHSTKINLSRYNSLFCNYDKAAGHRRTSTEVVTFTSSTQATDLTARDSERTAKHDDSSEEVVGQQPASSEVPEEFCRVSDGTTSGLSTKGERSSEYEDAGYDCRIVSESGPTTHSMELVHQRRPDGGCQSSSVSVSESYAVDHQPAAVVAAQKTAVSIDSGPPGAYTVLEDSQRTAGHIADTARHQQSVVATTHEVIVSTVHSRRDVAEQRPVQVLSTLRPDVALVLSSAGKRRSSGAEVVDVQARSMSQRRELYPPPPYPHRHPHPYPPMAPPGLSPRDQAAVIQSSRSTLDHHPAMYAYRKENSAGPRTVYVQPMRAENQASAVVQPSSACIDREVDVIVCRQACSDISPRGYVVSDAVFPINRVSPPTMALRTGVRAAYDQRQIAANIHESVGQSHYVRQPTADMQPRHHINRYSNPQTSRSALDGVYQQLSHPLPPPSTTNVKQSHVTMTSSTTRDVIINRHQIDRLPLDHLQHFVDGRRIPAGHVAGDPQLRRLSPPSPGLMTSGGHLNNVEGRSHNTGAGVDYAPQRPSAAVPLVRAAGDCLAINEADLARRGVGLSAYQVPTGHPPRFPPGATAASPHSVLMQRDLNPSQPLPPRGLPNSGAAGLSAVPLDMSGAKRRCFASLNQVITGCINL